jgi:soluble lytic murein transglycosylase
MNIRVVRLLISIWVITSCGLSWGLSNEEFKQSFESARKGKWRLVNVEVQQHVLAPYIEFHRLKSQLPTLSPEAIQQFAKTYPDTPLYGWLKKHATNAYGKARKWDAVVALNAQAPADVAGRCIYYRAQLIADQALAFEGGRALWLHGKALPDECDDLFKAMISRGEIDNHMIWQRALLSLENGNTRLAKYVARKLTVDGWTPARSYLKTIIQHPDVLLDVPQKVSDRIEVSPLLTAAMINLANKNVHEAQVLWPKLLSKYAMSEADVVAINNSLARNSYKLPTDQRDENTYLRLVEAGNAEWIEPVLREAIVASQWHTVLYWTESVQGVATDNSYYQYWRARAFEQLGDQVKADAAYKIAASQRDFYGFLAAEKSSLPYALNSSAPQVKDEDLQAVDSLPAIQRINALWAINEHGLAIDEWSYLINSSPAKSGLFAEYALKNEWYGLSVQATIIGRHWDYVAHRFPPAYKELFTQWADERGVDPILLMAIARRESAFNKDAVSPVGARGLMQMMPSTAKQVGNQQDIDYRHSDQLLDQAMNVQLASSYVQTLLAKYDGNVVAALAGYNAGPNRTDRWLAEFNGAYDQFIESISYRETRDYVKAVLAYRVIFERLDGDEVISVFEPSERGITQYLSKNDTDNTSKTAATP